MLISNQFFEIKIIQSNIEWYKSKGYKCELGDIITVKAKDLTKGSHAKVKYMCDYCLENGVEKVIISEYRQYLRGKNGLIDKDCCSECQPKKYREVCQVKYGVDNVFQLENIKDKTKQTNVEKYGVEYATQNKEIKNKIENTCLDKYGVKTFLLTDECNEIINETILKPNNVNNVFQIEKIKQKSRKTCTEKYGAEYYTQTAEYEERIKLQNNERYNVDWYFQTDEFKNKAVNTNLKKYNAISYTGTAEYKAKAKETNLKRYNTEYPQQNQKIKDKTRETNIKRYGYPYTLCNPEKLKQVQKTLLRNGNVPTSSQQLHIYNLLKDSGYNVNLNYPLSSLFLDIALFLKGVKIDIEYDGAYWHQDANYDRRRDEVVKSHGWKVLRIRSRRLVPDLNQIQEAIRKLTDTDRMFTKITLDDWVENIEKCNI